MRVIERVINHVLESVNCFAQVEQGCVFVFTKDSGKLVLTHECCMAGVLPHKAILESIHDPDFALWWY